MATEGVQEGGQTASLKNFEFVKFEFFFIWDCVGLKRVTETRLSYNCAHLRLTKESLTIEYLRIIFL